jgi:hypothetical protein
MGDYARYMAEHVAGARGVPRLVSAESYRKLHTPPVGSPYALGWGVGSAEWAGGAVLSHGGSNLVWFAAVWLAPARDFSMLVVTNAGGETAQETTSEVRRALAARFAAAFGGS